MNQDTTIAWKYHEATKHSYWSVRTSAHFLDWENQPLPFKIYPELEVIPLPRELPETGVSTFTALGEEIPPPGASKDPIEMRPTLEQLAHILFYSAGITKKKTYPGGEFFFRAAACAGALYPIEVYVVCADLPDLPAGVYHFSPADFGVRRVREGDHRSFLAAAAAHEPSLLWAPVVLVYTAISWRSAWKYRARAYRYHFWDCGMILANAMAAATAWRLPHKLIVGFQDDLVNHLVGVDGEREMSLALLTIGQTAHPLAASDPMPMLPEVRWAVVPLSREEVPYPLIHQMHAASRLHSAADVHAWRAHPLRRGDPEPEAALFPLDSRAPLAPSEESLESVIRRRASTRRFARKPISLSELSTILEYGTRRFPCDAIEDSLNDLYVNAHAVESLPPGAYFFHHRRKALELLKSGDFRRDSRYLCLEQDLGGDASATVFFLADLRTILAHYGNRGYRLAQLEAGIIGGKFYLTAYALRRGATGLTFYDDDVTAFFSPHAEGKSAIFVMALGVAGPRPRW
ncbi:MAG: SagB family peptide dehydrogenase [Blastocatellia bacterium]|nr:SagB family peptide dehydrogenase [Blastocatellia bacterium]MCS7156380.1 SagB family peptide dehydrogenase [Blastocatellia bacterium]MCX7751269.1 SagB family peptide dehydrogenase [Blastocatellia bacterium]MDW8168981.1 SagB family peptide dehydrogenase [Acidobacteriota bacterium]MDW8256741.1 SagB family peptide dehydrogenase [Acidobacteriota bacterium]